MSRYYNTSDELYHYGVKGMKWGVRRYQNPDGTLTAEGKRHYNPDEDFVIKKGSLLDRTSSEIESKDHKYVHEGDGTFLSYGEEDAAWYRRYMGAALDNQMNGTEPIYAMKYRADNDIIVPSERHRIDAFIKTISENEEANAICLKAMNASKKHPEIKYFGHSYKSEYQTTGQEVQKKYADMKLSNIQSEQIASYLNGGIVYSISDFEKPYYENLRKAGYNAIIDPDVYNDYGSAGNPKNSFYVLDAKKNVTPVSYKRIK